jgi:hypothetical protein
LYKTLLKTKSIVDSNLLPSYVALDAPQDNSKTEDALFIANVTARLYNAKKVKEMMAEFMSSMYTAAGLPNRGLAKPLPKKAQSQQAVPDRSKEQLEKKVSKKSLEVWSAGEQSVGGDIEASNSNGDTPWCGFDSGSESESNSLSRYDGLLGGSSESESDQDDDEDREPSKLSVGISRKALLDDISLSDSGSSRSPSPLPKTKKKKKTGAPAPTKAGSTFLPTLMGGYWSGTEESGTNDEEVAPPPRKNRRGQRARQAIAEKKHGANAAHIKNKPAPAPKNRDRDWDAQRGARSDDVSGRGGNSRVARFLSRSKEQVTGENATELGTRKKAVKDRDDLGVLHPSWVAAKKAKDEKKQAKFAGKKVVFD